MSEVVACVGTPVGRRALAVSSQLLAASADLVHSFSLLCLAVTLVRVSPIYLPTATAFPCLLELMVAPLGVYILGLLSYPLDSACVSLHSRLQVIYDC